jgi:hypothetical protein
VVTLVGALRLPRRDLPTVEQASTVGLSGSTKHAQAQAAHVAHIAH